MKKWIRSEDDPAAAVELNRWTHGLTGVLKRTRVQRGVTQYELAEVLGVAQGSISALETAPQHSRVEHLYAVCRVLGLELVVRERAPQPERRE